MQVGEAVLRSGAVQRYQQHCPASDQRLTLRSEIDLHIVMCQAGMLGLINGVLQSLLYMGKELMGCLCHCACQRQVGRLPLLGT